ncbi:FAD-dependent monooxygenase [Nocardioides acrostichi]|uniref:FAD-dependent monooxygenase n=1 Tax=Nocardioides acrostichi TaxID=2784339 RepID=A0A930Y7D3_9ACTN|nr:FAD-dependent monooxygenase [Nocardioides acrostichi]MBF4163295.1 FAD-dependent monooxygenase [Nocardioides acrostichi]
MLDAAVVVIGAGPVGLASAVELGVRGQSVVVLDEGDGTVDHPRAGGISMRTMEFHRRWGTVEDVRNCGFPDDYDLDIVFSTGFGGYQLIREHYPPLGEMGTPPESPERRQRCPQMWMDPILARAAASQESVEIRYGARVGDVEVAADGTVLVRYADAATGQEREVTARYALACDGAASATRTRLGIEMSGIELLNYSVGVFFRCPGLLEKVGEHQAARFIFISPDGPVGNLTVVDGMDLWRFTYMAGKERLDLEALDVESVMRRVLGEELEFDILSIAPWRRSQLVADSYRAGPVFLVGDSAHTMSPTGGFGANTGIGEAVDIGWKLDAVLRGWGGQGLLESYEVERRPIALRNTQAATSNFRGWYSTKDLGGLLEPGEDGDVLRREVGEELMAATRAEWESKGVILGYRYEDSPICVSDGSPAPADDYRVYEPTNRPGHRAPHAWLPDGRSVLDLYGEGFVLVDLGSEEADSAELLETGRAMGVPVRREALGQELADLYRTRFTLVRPDGHVAWRGDESPADAAAVWRVVTGHAVGASDATSSAQSQPAVS